MFKNRPQVVLMVYGKGGHTAQMQRFLNNAPDELKDRKFIALSDITTKNKDFIEQFFCVEARDKFSYIKNTFVFIVYFFWALVQMIRILFKYKVTGLISTGPGLAVVPAAICRLCGKKVIYFESWSRIYTPSLAGKIMYRIANVFFIQHNSMQKHYPQAIYSGRL
jgi:UDP-N-acetylglucosamine:LPS N-acetylglucosamine transferase